MENINSKISRLNKHGFSHIFGSNIIFQAANLIMGVLLVRLLSVQEYGVYSYALSFFSISLMFNGFGSTNGIMYFGSKYISDDPKLGRAYLKYGFKLGVISDFVIILLIIILPFVINMKISGSETVLISISGLHMMIFLIQYFKAYLRVHDKTKAYSAVNISNSLLLLLFMIAGAYFYGLYGVIFLRYAAYILSIVIALILSGFKLGLAKGENKLSREQRKDFTQYSSISMANTVVVKILYSIDVLLLGMIMADSQIVAVYKTATVIPFALSFIPSTLGVFIFPKFVQNSSDKKWIKKNYFKILKYFSAFNILVTAVLFIFAPIIIKIIFGAEYMDAVIPFRILSFSYFVSATFRDLSSQMLVMLKKVKMNLLFGIATGVINILLDYFLIKTYGMIGAAAATLISLFVSSVFVTSYLYIWFKNK